MPPGTRDRKTPGVSSIVRYLNGMFRFIRKILTFVMFGRSASIKPSPLNDEQRFMLEQFRMGLISEGEWRDLLDHDPVLSEHFRFHHPDMPNAS
jgi:hypothetical protein